MMFLSTFGTQLIILYIILLVPELGGNMSDGQSGECSDTLTNVIGSVSLSAADLTRNGSCVIHIHVQNATALNIMSSSEEDLNNGSVVLHTLVFNHEPRDADLSSLDSWHNNTSINRTFPGSFLWLRVTVEQGQLLLNSHIRLWSLAYVADVPACNSSSLPEPEHGIVTMTDTNLGSTAYLQCSEGYVLEDGSGHFECAFGEDGLRWLDDGSSCVSTCNHPPHVVSATGHLVMDTLANSRPTGLRSNQTMNSSVTYICREPYVMQGLQTLYCGLDLRDTPRWSGPVPTCVIPDCSSTIILRQHSGAIVNPSYQSPNLRGGSISCTWEVIAPENSSVSLSFVYLDLPPGQGVEVIVFDSGGARPYELLRLRGQSQPENVTSHSSKVTITYHGPAKDVIGHRGFYIRYIMRARQFRLRYANVKILTIKQTATDSSSFSPSSLAETTSLSQTSMETSPAQSSFSSISSSWDHSSSTFVPASWHLTFSLSYVSSRDMSSTLSAKSWQVTSSTLASSTTRSTPWDDTASTTRSTSWGDTASTTRSTLWGDTASTTRSTLWGDTASTTRSTSWGDIVSSTRSTSWGDIVSSTLSTSWSDTTSTTLSTSWSDTTSTTLSTSWSDTTSMTLSTSWGDTTSTTLSTSWGDTTSMTLSTSWGDTTSTTLSTSWGDTTSTTLSTSWGDTTSTTLSTSWGDTSSNTLSTSLSDTPSTTLSTSLDAIVSTTRSRSWGDTSSTTLSTSWNDRFSITHATSWSDTASTTHSTSWGDTSSTTLSTSWNDRFSITHATSWSDTASTTHSTSWGDTASSTRSTSLGDTASSLTPSLSREIASIADTTSWTSSGHFSSSVGIASSADLPSSSSSLAPTSTLVAGIISVSWTELSSSESTWPTSASIHSPSQQVWEESLISASSGAPAGHMSTAPQVYTSTDDSSDDLKIALGVVIPLVILVSVLVGVYICYRKKYPVRMIIGREFAKFSNPEYARPRQVASLIREDADDYFMNRNSSGLTSEEFNPVNSRIVQYENQGFIRDDIDDQEERERTFLERKSWLFKKTDEETGLPRSGGITHKPSDSPKSRGTDSLESTDSELSEILSKQKVTPVPARRKKKIARTNGSVSSVENLEDKGPSSTPVSLALKETTETKPVENVAFSSGQSLSPATEGVSVNVTNAIQLFDEVWAEAKERSRSFSVEHTLPDSRVRSFSVDPSKTARKMSLRDEFRLATHAKSLASSAKDSPKVPKLTAAVVGVDIRDRQESFASSILTGGSISDEEELHYILPEEKERCMSMSSVNSNPHLVTDLDEDSQESRQSSTRGASLPVITLGHTALPGDPLIHTSSDIAHWTPGINWSNLQEESASHSNPNRSRQSSHSDESDCRSSSESYQSFEERKSGGELASRQMGCWHPDSTSSLMPGDVLQIEESRKTSSPKLLSIDATVRNCEAVSLETTNVMGIDAAAGAENAMSESVTKPDENLFEESIESDSESVESGSKRFQLNSPPRSIDEASRGSETEEDSDNEDRNDLSSQESNISDVSDVSHSGSSGSSISLESEDNKTSKTLINEDDIPSDTETDIVTSATASIGSGHHRDSHWPIRPVKKNVDPISDSSSELSVEEWNHETPGTDDSRPLHMTTSGQQRNEDHSDEEEANDLKMNLPEGSSSGEEEAKQERVTNVQMDRPAFQLSGQGKYTLREVKSEDEDIDV